MQTTMDEQLVSTGHRPGSAVLSRRALIGGMVAGGAALALPMPAMAAGTEWRLAIRNVHTNESVDALFARSGQFLPQGLA